MLATADQKKLLLLRVKPFSGAIYRFIRSLLKRPFLLKNQETHHAMDLTELKKLGVVKNNYKGEPSIAPYFDQGLNITVSDIIAITESPQYRSILSDTADCIDYDSNLPWTNLANICYLGNMVAGHRIRFGVGMSGGFQSSEDCFIFTCWESAKKDDTFSTPEISKWIRLVYRLVELQLVPSDTYIKQRSKHFANRALKADCIEARLQSVGTSYMRLCHQTAWSPEPPLPWKNWDKTDYAVQTLWVFTRSIQNYVVRKGHQPDPEIRQFLILQGKAQAGKSVLMSAVDRLFKSLGMNGGSLPNSNTFSALEFASANYCCIDDGAKATGRGRDVNVLFSSAVVKSLVSGTSDVPYSMKNSSCSVPIKNKILVIQNVNHVNLSDIVGSDEGNLDRMRLLHVDRILFTRWFELCQIHLDRSDIPGSYDRLVKRLLYSDPLPPDPGYCRFDPTRYDLGQLILSVLEVDPGMKIETVLYRILKRFPDHYRIGVMEENGTLFNKLDPVHGDPKTDLSHALGQLNSLLARDPELPGVLKHSAGTWYALYQAVQNLINLR